MRQINRLASHWAPRLKEPIPQITTATPVTHEQWTHEQVGKHLDRMAKLCPAMIVRNPPKMDGGAIVLFRLPSGKIGQLDGRHRANLWRNCPGVYDVLILEL